ncbi:hypothetical protein [Kitasatospora sp. NPDC059599]|uniref:hypothetical protein n=1 Tax=Kitasatospora sp. NPDC059599 TaxID=3346880 RepID=UPI0036BCFCE2
MADGHPAVTVRHGMTEITAGTRHRPAAVRTAVTAEVARPPEARRAARPGRPDCGGTAGCPVLP